MNDRDDRAARAWMRIQRDWWAFDVIDTAVEKHPRKAWRLLGRLAELATTDELIEIVGAGPLEDFVRFHAPKFIRQIERRAAEAKRFKLALCHVRLPSADDAVSRRLFALGCRAIKTERTPWQSGYHEKVLDELTAEAEKHGLGY